ncbi:MAG TPA: methyl-accepting chemotaxis protein [Caulobacteraceae bacterium]
MKRLADLPLIVKMGFAPLLALIALAAVTGIGYVAQKQQSAALQRVAEKDMVISLRFAALEQKIAADHGQMYVLIARQASGDGSKVAEGLKDLTADVVTIQKDLTDLRASAPKEEQSQLDTLAKNLKDFHDAVDVVGSMVGVDANTATAFALPFEKEFQKMTSTLHATAQAVQAESKARSDQSIAAAKAGQTLSTISAVLALLGVGVVSWIGVMGMKKSIGAIAEATSALAKGDTSRDLDKLARKDELGAIVRSLAVFKDNQIHLAQMQAEQQTLQGQQESMRREQERQRAENAERQQAVVSSLAEGLDHLADGDLTFRLNTQFSEEYEKLRADFNGAMGRLQDTMKVIAHNTQGMRSGAGEISQAADDLSRRTEQQAASLEETAAALDQITATVRRTAEGANQAQSVVSVAKGDAERSGQVVRDAVGAMGRIEQSAKEISQIISVIDEIAFQTNLLALNAGVEAARAGDAGRGFAVVASEVRALAQRSAEAAKEIKALISTSAREVDAGVTLVGQTGQALQRIVTQIAEINGVVAEISASAAEQSTGLHQVNSAVNQMDQVTQQNAAMVEQSTAASHALAREAEELARLISRFQVGDTVAVRADRRPAAPAAAPRASAGAPAYSRAATARKLEPQAEEEGWEEF